MGVRQELLSDCTMKSVGEGTAKTRVNINIFLSQDVNEDGFSDNEGPSIENHVVGVIFSKFYEYSCSRLIKKSVKTMKNVFHVW